MRKMTIAVLILFILVSCQLPRLSILNGSPENIEPLYPEPGSRDVPFDSLTLRWKFEDPERDPVTFTLYLSKDKEAVEAMSEEAVEETALYFPIYSVPERLDRLSTYYWRIVAKDRFGNESVSEVWSFTTSGLIVGEEVSNADRNDEALKIRGRYAVGYKYGDWGKSGVIWDWENASILKVYERLEDNELWDVYDGIYEVLLTGCIGDKLWVLKKDGVERSFGEGARSCGRGVVKGSDGYYYVVGWVEGYSSDYGASYGGKDMLVLKLDGNLNKVWALVIGGSGDEEIRGVVDTGGGILVVGYTDSANLKSHADMYSEPFVAKIGYDKTVEWKKAMGLGGADYVLNSVAKVRDGYVAVGYTDSMGVEGAQGGRDAYVVKIGENGEIIWERAFGGSREDVALDVANDGDGYVIVGYSLSWDGVVNEHHDAEGKWKDGWVFKVSADGEFVWGDVDGEENDDVLNSIIVTEDGYEAVGYKTIDGEKDAWFVEMTRP